MTLRTSPLGGPVCENAHQTAADVLAAMAPHAGSPAVLELHALLHKANMKVWGPASRLEAKAKIPFVCNPNVNGESRITTSAVFPPRVVCYSVVTICLTGFPLRLEVRIRTNLYMSQFILSSSQFAFALLKLGSTPLLILCFGCFLLSHSSFAFTLNTSGISA